MRTPSVCLLAALLLSGPALAKRADKPEQSVKKFDFLEDDVVEGEWNRPFMEVLGVLRPTRHSSLVKVRATFVPELLKSAEDT